MSLQKLVSNGKVQLIVFVEMQIFRVLNPIPTGVVGGPPSIVSRRKVKKNWSDLLTKDSHFGLKAGL